MTKMVGAFAVGTIAALGLLAAASAQDRSPTAAGSSLDQLLGEVRALRADINRAASASMSAQLVGMRLQLQEGRIGTLSRQLSETQGHIHQQERMMAMLAPQLKMFESEKDPAQKAEAAFFIAPLKAQLAELEKTIQQLKQDEAAVSQLLAEEQSRWTRFNTQIEALEQAIKQDRP